MSLSLNKDLVSAHNAVLMDDKTGDHEQIIDSSTDNSGREANVGLHEFDLAKQSGRRVSPQESRR